MTVAVSAAVLRTFSHIMPSNLRTAAVSELLNDNNALESDNSGKKVPLLDVNMIRCRALNSP